MDTLFNIPIIPFVNESEWERWLKDNTADQIGVWIKIAKKGSGITSITYAEALDVSLCYGWIDGQRRGLDMQYFLQKFTPRRKQSLWSKVNIGKVEVLIETGRMQPAGLAEIERAQADGRWDAAYESQANATIPADLEHALEHNESARKFYASLTKAEKYSVLWRLMTAKSPDIRAARLQKMIALLEAETKI